MTTTTMTTNDDHDNHHENVFFFQPPRRRSLCSKAALWQGELPLKNTAYLQFSLHVAQVSNIATRTAASFRKVNKRARKQEGYQQQEVTLGRGIAVQNPLSSK